MIELNEKTWIAIEDMVVFNYPVEPEEFFDENFSMERLKTLCEGKRFIVFNETDQIFASMDIMDIETAVKFVENFPKRYEIQGYYRTSQGIAIPPSSVRYCILAYDEAKGDENFAPLPF